jgi:hypothetical protein
MRRLPFYPPDRRSESPFSTPREESGRFPGTAPVLDLEELVMLSCSRQRAVRAGSPAATFRMLQTPLMNPILRTSREKRKQKFAFTLSEFCITVSVDG